MAADVPWMMASPQNQREGIVSRARHRVGTLARLERAGLHPGDVSMAFMTSVCFLIGILLFALPADKMSGPELAVVYDLAPRSTWALVFIAVGLAPLLALISPSVETRKVAVAVLTLTGLSWTAGLTLPLLTGGAGNAWAPVLCGIPTGLGFITWAAVPFEAPFWRPVRQKG